MRTLTFTDHHYLKVSHPSQSQHIDHATVSTGELQYVLINIQVYVSVYDTQ